MCCRNLIWMFFCTSSSCCVAILHTHSCFYHADVDLLVFAIHRGGILLLYVEHQFYWQCHSFYFVWNVMDVIWISMHTSNLSIVKWNSITKFSNLNNISVKSCKANCAFASMDFNVSTQYVSFSFIKDEL